MRCWRRSAGPIELLLGDRIYSRNGDPLEAVVGELLRKHHATVSVAESCTGGMLGERFTSVPGSSEYFVGGFITYTDKMKVELLGVPPEMLEQFGAVSKEAAEAMAMGARRRTGRPMRSRLRASAGPEPGTDKVPKGTMYVGIADASGSACRAPAVFRRPPAHPDLHLPDGAGYAAAADHRVDVKVRPESRSR